MKFVKLGLPLVLAAIAGLAQQAPRVGLSPVPLWQGGGKPPAGGTNDSIFFDPVTDEVVILSRDESASGAEKVLRFELHNKAVPIVSAKVSPEADGYFTYEYVIRSDPASRRPLEQWSLLIPAEPARVPAAPAGWRAWTEATDMPDQYVPGPGILEYVHFTAEEGRALAPGAGMSGVRLRSRWLPGYATAFARSKAVRPLSPRQLAQLPPATAERVQALLAPQMEMHQATVLSPRFAPDTPVYIVAAALHFSVQHLGRTARRLDLGSPFVQAALSALAGAIEEGRGRPFSVNELQFLKGAQTEAERELAQVLRISLTQAGE